MFRTVFVSSVAVAMVVGCAAPPMRVPAPAPMQRFCAPGENPVINHCREFAADQVSGGTVRGNHDQNNQ